MTSQRLLLGWMALFTLSALGLEQADLMRGGYFRELTDGESAGYAVNHVRMSADGSMIAFMTGATSSANTALRVIRADGSGEKVIFENTAGGDYTLLKAFDISDDGRLVAFEVLVAGTSADAEIWLYNTTSRTTIPLLTELPHSSWGTTSSTPIQPEADLTTLVMTGDGSWLFFLNGFGPQGYNGDDLTVSGRTIYKVSTSDFEIQAEAEIEAQAEAQPVFTTADIQNVTDVSESAVTLMCAGGTLATDETGSVLIVPVGGSMALNQPSYHLLRLDLGDDGVTASIVLNLADMYFSGPGLSSDGTRMAFSRYGGLAPTPAGLFVMSADGTDDALLVDPGAADSGVYPTYPVLSGDGTYTAQNLFLGGASSPTTRTSPDDGAGPIPVSIYTTTVKGDGRPSISSDGSRIAFPGSVQPDNMVQHADVVVFDWYDVDQPPSGVPLVTGVTAEPEFELIRQTRLSAETTAAYSYTTDDGGTSAGWMYSAAFDSAGLGLLGDGIYGMGRYYEALFDDGLEGDTALGDGIFDDIGIWAYLTLADDLLTGRGAVTSHDGSASFVDFPVTVREPVPPPGRVFRVARGRTGPPRSDLHQLVLRRLQRRKMGPERRRFL